MEPIHIFYKELSTHENNIFTSNLAEKFKRSREYAVAGLSINQDLDYKIIDVTDTDRLERISKLIQKLVKEKKEPDLDLRIRNEETIEKVIRFQRKAPTKHPRLKLTF